MISRFEIIPPLSPGHMGLATGRFTQHGDFDMIHQCMALELNHSPTLGYAASGFSLHFHLALSKMRGELKGFKLLRDLGLLGQNVADKHQISRRTGIRTDAPEMALSTNDEHVYH